MRTITGSKWRRLTVFATAGNSRAVAPGAFLVETESDPVSNEGATVAEASRLRLILEGSRAFELDSGAVLTPGVELGLRHDGGDAKTGTGVELGGSVGYADPGTGLSVEARARMLVAHADSDYEEWGANPSVRLAPGESGRGLSFSLSPALGAAASGADRLWRAERAADLAPAGSGFEAARGLRDELGYGLGLFGDRGHAERWVWALGQCARMPHRLAPDLRDTERPGVRGQSRRHTERGGGRHRAARARGDAQGHDPLVTGRREPRPPARARFAKPRS